MELHELKKKRDAYAGKIAQLAITIAIIFALPAGLAIGLSYWFSFSVMYALLPACVISWVLVILIYRKVDREVRELEMNIAQLQHEE
jgi:uncharacterized membrane protein YhdT